MSHNNISTKPTDAVPVDHSHDDPAIAAIAAHRQIWERLLAAQLPADEDAEPDLARRWHRLSSWEILAAEKVARTVPTTVEGAKAFATWVKEILFFEEPGRHSVALDALDTMRTCIERLAKDQGGQPVEDAQLVEAAQPVKDAQPVEDAHVAPARRPRRKSRA